MANLSISELQFAFTFFKHFCALQREPYVDFIFPTLRQEGNPDGDYAGADLVVSDNLFIQFKIPKYLKRRNTVEIANGDMNEDFLPYFRMPIKNEMLQVRNNSGQFNLLKNAANNGKNAMYLTPLFNNWHTDQPRDPNYWFRRFFSVDPVNAMNFVVEINFDQFTNIQLEDNNKHKICYNYHSVVTQQTAYLYSEPKPIKAAQGLSFLKEKQLKFTEGGRRSLPTISENLNIIVNDLNLEPLLYDQKMQLIGPTLLGNDLTVSMIQQLLLSFFGIFWIPVTIDRAEKIDNLINKII